MAVNLSMLAGAGAQFFDNSGVILSGGLVYTYAAGTTTPQAAYTTSSGSVAHTNPIVLDSAGRVASGGEIWLTDAVSYKFVLKTATGTTIGTYDNVTGNAGSILAAFAASSGSSLVGYILNKTNAVATTVQTKLRQTISVFDFMTAAQIADVQAGTLSIDVSTPINNAILAIGNGQSLYFPAGNYKVLSPILCENVRGIKLYGDPGQLSTSGSRIIAYHTGKCTLSLIGSLNCVIESLSIEADTSARPKVGLILGRSSAASAGGHTFISMTVTGYYQYFGVYNIASEENTFVSCYLVPYTAIYGGLYMAQGESVITIGGLTGSSMTANTFIGGVIGNVDGTAGSASIYLDCGAAFGHISFFNNYMTQKAGSAWIYIRLGVQDGLSTDFPISFYNVVGEYNTTRPNNSIRINNGYSGRATSLSGLTIINAAFQTPIANTILCNYADESIPTPSNGVELISANISTPYSSSSTAPSTFQLVQRSNLHMNTESTVTFYSLKSSYVETNAPPVISVDLGGNVLLDNAGTTYQIPAFTKRIALKRTIPTYGASISIDAFLGNEFDINVTNGTAFTITNPVNSVDGQRISIKIRNASGGAMGAITWGGAFLYSAWTNPANGFSRTIDFVYNGTTAWVEASRTPADVPN